MNVRQKMAKLKEQKRVADEINELLTRPGEDGLNESSRKTMKNLEVAVVVSKRPGFFDYYKVGIGSHSWATVAPSSCPLPRVQPHFPLILPPDLYDRHRRRSPRPRSRRSRRTGKYNT